MKNLAKNVPRAQQRSAERFSSPPFCRLQRPSCFQAIHKSHRSPRSTGGTPCPKIFFLQSFLSVMTSAVLKVLFYFNSVLELLLETQQEQFSRFFFPLVVFVQRYMSLWAKALSVLLVFVISLIVKDSFGTKGI